MFHVLLYPIPELWFPFSPFSIAVSCFLDERGSRGENKKGKVKKMLRIKPAAISGLFAGAN
jgi:hypothetical protein